MTRATASGVAIIASPWRKGPKRKRRIGHNAGLCVGTAKRLKKRVGGRESWPKERCFGNRDKHTELLFQPVNDRI